jgi:cytochrome c-type biogenesis protein CcmH
MLALTILPSAFASGPPKPSLSSDAGELLRRLLGPFKADDKAKPSVQEVSEGLTCQCGCGLTVANCNHPTCGFSVPVRGEIEGMIKAGMKRSEIIAGYRHKYGEKVLSAPTTEGFNILAWTAPFAAVFAGAILILFAVGRWRAAAPAQTPDAPECSLEPNPRLKQILARELRERF